MVSKYYVPKQKVKINCKRCGKVFIDTPTRKFCSFKCKSQFNEKKFRERAFMAKHREEIWKILGYVCFKCGGEANELHHQTYNIPVRKINYSKRRKYNKVTLEDVNKMLKEYCQYLTPLCSTCHHRI